MTYKGLTITVPKVRPAAGVPGTFLAVAVVNGLLVTHGHTSEVFPADGPTAEAASTAAIEDAKKWIEEQEAEFSRA